MIFFDAFSLTFLCFSTIMFFVTLVYLQIDQKKGLFDFLNRKRTGFFEGRQMQRLRGLSP